MEMVCEWGLVSVCVSFLRTSPLVCECVYKLKCLNICISFCLSLTPPHSCVCLCVFSGGLGVWGNSKVFVVTTLVFGGGAIGDA